MKSERHSISAVAELKEVTDTSDNFLIYEMNDGNMNTKPSFVFKSSRKMAKMALNMDQDYPCKNPLMEEVVYFDGMHTRCKGWKTLTLWVYHPVSRRLMRLATMEVKHEDTPNCVLFWKVFNKMLSVVKGEDNYKFNPVGFMTDEGGAVLNGIKEIFGDDGMRKTYTCQFHFKQCLHRQVNKIPNELNDIRTEFEMLAIQMLTVSTLPEWKTIKARLDTLGGLTPSIATWLEWWVTRYYHLFPVFRGYCLSSLNLAEIGQSTLKHKKMVMLVDAAWEDVATMIQEEEHTKFLRGEHRSYGERTK